MKTSVTWVRLARRFSLPALLFGLAACSKEVEPASPSGAEPPAEAKPVEPAQAEPMAPSDPPAPNQGAHPATPEQCQAAGGSFVPSIGDEPKCPEGTSSLGPVRHGVEGGLCCK